MQIRIALCDDEIVYHETVKRLLTEYKHEVFSVSFSLTCFSSGWELLDYIDKNKPFDIYILDIIMPEINGIQLGAGLRKQNDNGLLIYLTSTPDFAVESYNTNALHYLLKPINDKHFFQCMDKTMNRLQDSPVKSISVKMPGSTRIVPIQDILYAERVDRCIRYRLSNGITIDSVTFNDSFQNAVSPLISRHDFLIVGSSFAVNLYHVTEITKSDMLLTGNYIVPIPRRAYKTVKEKWEDYWINRGKS